MGLNSKTIAILAALACSAGGISSVSAAPAVGLATGVEAPSPLVEAGSKRNWHKRPRFSHRRHGLRVYRHRPRVVVPHFNGHRGWHRSRPGYRRHSDGWWYPRAAFGVQIIIGQPRYHRRVIRRGGLPAAHYAWCDRRYRSYRAWDDTFQPYHGPRRFCNSPYDGR